MSGSVVGRREELPVRRAAELLEVDRNALPIFVPKLEVARPARVSFGEPKQRRHGLRECV